MGKLRNKINAAADARRAFIITGDVHTHITGKLPALEYVKAQRNIGRTVYLYEEKRGSRREVIV